MEDTLRVLCHTTCRQKAPSLNPCFNGRYSQRDDGTFVEGERNGLNPCFNGRYSQRGIFSSRMGYTTVLILVLMEDTLRESLQV